MSCGNSPGTYLMNLLQAELVVARLDIPVFVYGYLCGKLCNDGLRQTAGEWKIDGGVFRHKLR